MDGKRPATSLLTLRNFTASPAFHNVHLNTYALGIYCWPRLESTASLCCSQASEKCYYVLPYHHYGEGEACVPSGPHVTLPKTSFIQGIKAERTARKGGWNEGGEAINLRRQWIGERKIIFRKNCDPHYCISLSLA